MARIRPCERRVPVWDVRSVRRWISELMDELGVTTRLQLGAAMVRAEYIRTQTSGMMGATASSRP